MEEVAKCTLHDMKPRKCVAFEGANTGRRFYGCPVQGGVNCGVVQWVDPAWPDVLKNCLIKLWEMFHEQNLGRIQDKHAYEDDVAKLKKDYDLLCTEYHKMVDDVSKMFDWQDGVGKIDYQKAMDAEKFEKQKEELELEMKMEKLRLAKEQRCILQAQADIIHNTRKAMKEIKVDRDLLAQEKTELEKVVADLLNAGHGSKEKLEKIKAILEA
ncbi:uncharacterized protein [Triticum aestivum]|uniref:uncharacterized protein n=1 Tax=Triticum aestivum TaxID=4565 RepID=UPI001D0045B7|nr:uncharacterized protein LOC123153489 [Triticum aestivum]